MKKRLAVVLALVLVVAMMLCACGGSGKTDKIDFATGGTSGTYYGFIGSVATTLNEESGMDITVESTGASQANVQLIQIGENNMAIIQNDIMSYAYNGQFMFEGNAFQGMSVVMSCYPEDIQIVASPNVSSIEDLAGRTVSVGASDSGTRYNAEQILASYGITFDDINVVYESFADSVDSLKNGTIDAAFITAGSPTTAVTELATSYEFNLLSVDDAHAQALADEYGFYTTVTIPGGTYSCIEEDVQTVAVMATIVCSNDLSADTVKAFLTGMFEHAGDISHAKAAYIKGDTAVSGVSIPFHPGAVEFFGDMGYDIG
ncbi:MAG: TAXI family TRAP transporter solute-binding subunit [Oscillospiraceae bacterium]|nr:TAXI family TRAP transporter solute-binding subunit [Oscillospiraceae bacterium]